MTSTIYESSNMAFVAALLGYGARIEKVDKTNPKRTIFFIDTSEVDRVHILEAGVPVTVLDKTYDEILNLFVSDKLLLLPNYMDKVSGLKSLIYG